jgi:two-component system sensor histidine kinase EvgS
MLIKVLLVEDSQPSRILYSRYLESLGFVPVCASDGKRGLQCLEDDPDIVAVVTDCRLPGMDGMAMAQEIRSLMGDDMPIVLYSANPPPEEARGILNRGYTAFLNAPVSRAGLGESLGRYLGMKSDFRNREARVNPVLP